MNRLYRFMAVKELLLSNDLYPFFPANALAHDWIHDMSVKEQMGANRWRDSQKDIAQLTASLLTLQPQQGGISRIPEKNTALLREKGQRRRNEETKKKRETEKKKLLEERRNSGQSALSIENEAEEVNHEKNILTIYLLLGIELYRKTVSYGVDISIVNIFFSDLMNDKLKLYIILYFNYGINRVKDIIYNDDEFTIGTRQIDGLELFYFIDGTLAIRETEMSNFDSIDENIERMKMNLFGNYLDFGNLNSPVNAINRFVIAYRFYMTDLDTVFEPIHFTTDIPEYPSSLVGTSVFRFAPFSQQQNRDPGSSDGRHNEALGRNDSIAMNLSSDYLIESSGGARINQVHHGGTTSEQCDILKTQLNSILYEFNQIYTSVNLTTNTPNVPDRNSFLESVVNAFRENDIALSDRQRAYLYGCYPDSTNRSSGRSPMLKYKTVEIRILELYEKNCKKIVDQAEKDARKAENEARLASHGELTEADRLNANNLNICLARLLLCLTGACDTEGNKTTIFKGTNYFTNAQFAILQNIAWRKNEFAGLLPAGNLDDKLEELIRQYIKNPAYPVDNLKKAYKTALSFLTTGQFVINNAANISNLLEGGGGRKDWSTKSFCPVGSVIDAMSLCPKSEVTGERYEWGSNFSVMVKPEKGDGAEYYLLTAEMSSSQVIKINTTCTFPNSTLRFGDPTAIPTLSVFTNSNIVTGEDLKARVVLRNVIVQLLEYYNRNTVGGTSNSNGYFASGFWQTLMSKDANDLFNLLKYTHRKYYGDGRQEFEALMKFAGYIDTTGPIYTENSIIKKFNFDGDAVRRFFANDRPSMARYILLSVYGNGDVNSLTAGGYVGPKSTLLVERSSAIRGGRKENTKTKKRKSKTIRRTNCKQQKRRFSKKIK